MNTNINTDNYEAYLLDYIEGNLGPDETQKLKEFVAAQGMDWNELTEEQPHLEAPQIEFENKERLKKQRAIVPLYVKIASAAAAAGLLLTVSLWPEKSLPKVEPIAELKPIQASLTVTEEPVRIIPRRVIQFAEYQNIEKKSENLPRPIKKEEPVAIAALPSIETKGTTTLEIQDFDVTSEMAMLGYRLKAEQRFVQLVFNSAYEEEMPTSFIGKSIYRMTEGRCASIGDLIESGLHIAKKEVMKASIDATLTAYFRAEECIEETKEYWEEKMKP